MSVDTTPSKKVGYDVADMASVPNFSAHSYSQAASAIENLMMESPVKKPTFDMQADKENINLQSRYESDEVAVPIKGIPVLEKPSVDEIQATSVATGIKEEEEVEPILQENPQRFVLFPIKYHEVRVSLASSRATRRRVKCLLTSSMLTRAIRSGRCTKRPKHHSGLPRRLICQRIFTTGTSD